MNVRKASDEWGYTPDSIWDLCKYQFISGAHKKKFGWSIPDDAEKPPVTVNAFIVLMESIAEFKQGGNPSVCRKGLPKEKIKDALYYLSGFGFIAGYDENLEYPDNVKQASLIGDAYKVIAKYRSQNNLPTGEKRIGAEIGGEYGKIYTEKKEVF